MQSKREGAYFLVTIDHEIEALRDARDCVKRNLLGSNHEMSEEKKKQKKAMENKTKISKDVLFQSDYHQQRH